jgi:tRNA nucleotidyltransferase/poly(A) polymerase
MVSFAAKYADLIALKQPDQKLYFVGGVVRDIFLDRSHNDIDILVQGNSKEIARMFANHFGGAFFMLDEARNTARVVVNNGAEHLIYDFAQMQGIVIEDDLRLRDFTINAMAVDFDHPDQLIDPLGGREDLANHTLRICSATSFSQDPVRVIRAVRYSISCNVKIQVDTLLALKAAITGLQRVSWERKRDELFKILDTAKPGLGLEILARLGIINEMFGASQMSANCQFEEVTALHHLFEMLRGKNSGEANKDLFEASCNLRLGRYYPELVKYFFEKNQSERNIKQLCLLSSCLGKHAKPEWGRVLTLLLLSREEGARVNLQLLEKDRLDHIFSSEELTRRAKYLYFKDIGSVGIDLVFLQLANDLAKPVSEMPQEDWLKRIEKCETLISAWFDEQATVNPVMILNGKDLMMEFDLTPGPKIGILLDKLREEQAAGEIRTRQEALSWVEQQLPNLGLNEQ